MARREAPPNLLARARGGRTQGPAPSASTDPACFHQSPTSTALHDRSHDGLAERQKSRLAVPPTGRAAVEIGSKIGDVERPERELVVSRGDSRQYLGMPSEKLP